MIAGRKIEPEERCFIKRTRESIILRGLFSYKAENLSPCGPIYANHKERANSQVVPSLVALGDMAELTMQG